MMAASVRDYCSGRAWLAVGLAAIKTLDSAFLVCRVDYESK
jgi:hypothetical protein